MEKIFAMKLTRLSVEGFKCFADLTSFDFDDVTYITGSNHVGKSSIADAIAFAFTGKLYNGDSSMDRLYNENSSRLQVTAAFLDEHGKQHALVRTRANDVMSIIYDGYEIRQKDLTVMFGESDVFLSILNPTFFIERLGIDGQKLLQTYLPLVSHEDVLQRLTESQRALLEHQTMLSPDTYIKQLREENREFRESIIAFDGKKDLLQQQKQDGKERLDELNKYITELDKQIGSFRQKRENDVDFKGLEEERAGLLLRRDEMLSDSPKEPRTAQIDLNIHRAEADLEAGGNKQYESKYAPEIAKLQAELQAAGEEYRNAYAVFQNIRPGVMCPTCRRSITAETLEDTKAGLNQGLQNMMQRGMEIKAQLTELLELDQKAKDVFEQFKNDDLAKIRERIAQLHERCKTILAKPQEHEASLSEINKRISDVEASLDFGGLTVEEHTQLTGLETEREKLTAEHDAMKSIMEQPAPDLEKQKQGFEDGIRQNEELITATLDYLGARNELTFHNLPLHKVAFSLFDIYKTTGEVKNAFRFTYNGRDYRKLSHSEKIFAGMEVSELIKALTGRNYPVFVDDSESVVSLARIPTGQVLLSRVIPNQPLTVAGKSRQPVELPKAS